MTPKRGELWSGEESEVLGHGQHTYGHTACGRTTGAGIFLCWFGRGGSELRQLQSWISALIVSVLICACDNLPTMSPDFVNVRPSGEEWVLWKHEGDYLDFGRRTPKGKYHTILAWARSLSPDVRIGNATELLQYLRRERSKEYENERFANVDIKASLESYLGRDCVRVDGTVEDHRVPSAPGSIFILTVREYYCSHPARTDADWLLTVLHVSQRYLRGDQPLPIEAEVEPFFRSYLEGSTIPLLKAAKENDLATIQTLLAKGVDVNVRGDVPSDWGKTALMEASLRGDVNIVKALLEGRADVNAKDDYGDTALMFAAGKGHAAIVKLLLKAGADVNITRAGNTALIAAAKNGYMEIVQILLDAGSDVNIRVKGGTALTAAAWKGASPIVQALIEKGADVNAQNDIGMTALIFMAAWGNTSLVQALIEKGADVNAKNSSGHTVLEFAKGHPEVVQLLKKAGAKQ